MSCTIPTPPRRHWTQLRRHVTDCGGKRHSALDPSYLLTISRRLFAGEAKGAALVFPVLPPRPVLGEVSVVVERDHEMMDMAGTRTGEVGNAHEREIEFLRIAAEGPGL